ncbi:MAG TPA: adenylosuccinate lyase [Actinomycetota bacterium]|nr:adenylosuccinate lyase [Actinomycetota bacterium]
MIPRYSREEMAGIFSERAKFSRWLEVEILAVEARVRLGDVPVEDLTAIKERAAFDVGRIAEIEAVRHHDVVAFVENVRENVGDAGRHVHFGLTSSDVVDTAAAVALRDAGDLLVEEVGRLTETVRRKAFEHRDTLMAGRTHGVHAEPTTFGLKLAGWAFELARDRDRLRRARDAVATGKLSGAVGTYSQLSPEVEAYVCERLGLAVEPAATQVVARDRHAELLGAIALTGASLERIAQEIRHLQRTEVREAREPFAPGQKGSSAMPHKRNPIVCERICGLARMLRAYAQTGYENVALWHERDISHSSAERVALPDVTILLDYALSLALRLANGMVVHEDRMRENLEITCGALFSQRVLLSLVEQGRSRDDAYRIVQRLAQRAWDTGTPLRELLEREPGVELDLDGIFDYGHYVRFVPEVLARLDGLASRTREEPP